MLMIALFGVLGMIVHGTAQPFTPSQYIANTYMYIFLGIIGMGLVWCVKYSHGHLPTQTNPLVWLLLSILCIVGTMRSDPMVSHIWWVGLIGLLANQTYVWYLVNRSNQSDTKVLVQLFVIGAVLTIGAFGSTHGTYAGWGAPLMGVLVGLIGVELVDYFLLSHDGNAYHRLQGYSFVGLLLFSCFLVYDTDVLRGNASKLARLGNQTQCDPRDLANYPAASLGIGLDLLNLYGNLTVQNN